MIQAGQLAKLISNIQDNLTKVIDQKFSALKLQNQQTSLSYAGTLSGGTSENTQSTKTPDLRNIMAASRNEELVEKNEQKQRESNII